MLDVMSTSSQPSALRSPTLETPHGQKVLGADPVGDLLEPALAGFSSPKNALPKMLLALPASCLDSLHAMKDLSFSRLGVMSRLMSECMSVSIRSWRPSLFQSKNLTPIVPHGVFGKTSAVRSTNVLALAVLEVVVIALHVEHVEVRPEIAVLMSRRLGGRRRSSSVEAILRLPVTSANGYRLRGSGRGCWALHSHRCGGARWNASPRPTK